MSLKHGQNATPEVVQSHFERAIAEAQARYASWIHSIEWSGDRRSAKLAGPGYNVSLTLDGESVHASGQVPLAFKLLEGKIRSLVERMLAEQATSNRKDMIGPETGTSSHAEPRPGATFR
jgi:hypothetical protein